jgi:class 3 adenylate cyclase
LAFPTRAWVVHLLASSGTEYRILGPLEVLDEGRVVALGGGKPRALLAVMLLNPNEVLTTDRLIDALWGERAPPTAAKAVHVHVSRLRKALAAGAGNGGAGEGPLVTRERGYELQLDPKQLDSKCFERLVTEGRSELAQGRPRRALEVLEEALSLWRGEPLADLAYEPFAQAESARLNDLRVGALELLVEAKLALGRHSEVIVELETLIGDHPYRERLRGQLMLALYRCERQADALEAYQDARRALLEELGIEPGERLRALERAILAQDPALEPPGESDTRDGAGLATAPEGLPTGVVTFLLTDIERSSRLWELDADAMAAALELHDELVEKSVDAHGGRLLKAKGEGDATLSVFRRASEAVACAVECQRALLGAGWPGGLDLRVRVALHTGEAHEREGDYFGPALNRAARLRGLARGGTTVVSQATAEIVRDRLPHGAQLVDLGPRELPGLARPERVFELRPRAGAPQHARAMAPEAPDEAIPPRGEAPERPNPRALTPEHLAERIRAARGVLEGERKQLTVLFVDVVDSMELAERSGPERWRAIMERFLAILCAGVHRFEGTVDRFTGDGMLALFGAPISHEDHARRACYAALQLRDELAGFAADLRRSDGLSLSVRMGLNSGEVVVGAIGDDLGMEYTAVGHTVVLAERVERLAAPDRIYLSQRTASLAEGYLELGDLGEIELGGASQPLHVHELTGVGAARGGLDVARARGLTSFVGRDEELRTLEAAWGQALAGQGQLIGIVGDAGVGKSRLSHEFTERQRAKGVPVYQIAGQAHAKSVPLLPLLQVLRAYFEITELDSDQTARERIAGRLLLLDSTFEDELPLLFDFLAVPHPPRPAERMDPEARQRQLLALMKRLTRAQSAHEPGVTVVEDLHWLDPASELFLANHVEALQGTRGLTLVTFRPDYHAAWMARSYYRQLPLAPLGADAVEELLRDLLGSDPSLEGALEQVRERTQGNPFFIEELVQSLIDAGSVAGERGAYRLAAPVAQAALPASVESVLAARIDRLKRREKSVLQAAAVIGKEFSRPVLERVVGQPPAEVELALRGLVAGEFVYEHELYPEALYSFKHPLTREVAYRSQLSDRRASVHAGAARALAELYPERLDEHAALVAQHSEAAGETLEAARWHARAAAWSGTNDPRGALRHWRRVHKLADALPASTEAVALGLTARINSLNYGWRLGISPEHAQTLFTEAERMASEAGEIRSRALLLAVYGAIRGIGHGDAREYAELVRRAIAFAEESRDPALHMGVATGGYALHCIGEHREAVAVFDRAIELAGGDPSLAAGMLLGCPYAFCHVIKGLALIHLGELGEARRLIEQGRKLAHEQGDIETVGWSHIMSAWRAYFLGEPETALGHAQQAVGIAERIGDSFSCAWAWSHLGLAERTRGEWQPAVEALERSQAIARERRAALEGDGIRLAWLGESYLGLGDVERAHALVEEGLEVAHAHGTLWVEPYTSLARARVLLASAGSAAGEQIDAALARALKLARDTGAKAFEPLVHTELAELARQSDDQERRERELREARRLFTEIGANGQAERLADDLMTPPS